MGFFSRHLRSLVDFSGRENRQPFWLWVLTVYIAELAIGMLFIIPAIASMMTSVFAQAQRDPDYANAHPELMLSAIAPLFRAMTTSMIVLALLFVVLLAAAMVRRLHDGARSGWWAAPQVVLQLVSPLLYLTMMPNFFEAFAKLKPGTATGPDDPAFQQLTRQMLPMSLLGTLTFPVLVLTVVLLALPGTVGPNRYGADPLGRA